MLKISHRTNYHKWRRICNPSSPHFTNPIHLAKKYTALTIKKAPQVPILWNNS
ncbi:hypothetical protein THERMOS_866 [Bathymodiolus thermophilus thioautotrophic gill symbiont]|uniref:Uncharacterized protein n=1 Tax=Bathymodiolus thermophilus thioautotrophic gill symbiont TaxID=2360 RepID=A0A8H9CFF0_9GAMM|nr:hypothetical protein THERMOS_866 [Bathymodiolus thermophilus thioautotrophic gill symbiont]